LDESFSQKLSLIAPGSKPFHLKVSVVDKNLQNPLHSAEVEEWWAAPDQWRRVVTSPEFSQTAVQNGKQYSETNSMDYMPWWISDLLRELTDPLPVDDLKGLNLQRGGVEFGFNCVRWQAQSSNGTDKDVWGEGLCFDSAGLLHSVFTPSVVGEEFSKYEKFGGKQIARYFEIDTEGNHTVKAMVTLLEPLTSDASLFVVDHDTGYDSRLRFVTVPEIDDRSALPNRPPIVWPESVSHFPATGLALIEVRIDREGKVRSAESVISDNRDVDSDVPAQIMKWQFKPWIVDGAPVQVNTTITLRWNVKVEIPGQPTGVAAEPASKWFAGARRVNTLRDEDGKPFHLHATVANCGGSTTIQESYDEQWQSPTKWRREVDAGSVQTVEARDDDNFYRQITGADFAPACSADVLGIFDDPIPAADEVYEADWQQELVPFDGGTSERIRRGPKNPDGTLPANTYAFWFNPATRSLLGLHTEAPGGEEQQTTYGKFMAWEGKQVPGRIELLENGNQALLLTSDKIEDLGTVPDSTFGIAGIEPEKLRDPDDYEGSVSVSPRLVRAYKPANPPPGSGTVVIEADLDRYGRVESVKVVQSAGLLLDEAAKQAAMTWVFEPAIFRNQAVPTKVKFQIPF
jgi:TonB family protein